MKHLKSFYVFNIAAQSSSFTDAAKHLCITHGAVSKQIKVLEDYLSQPLFYKSGRQVKLTHEGQLLKGFTEQAFTILEDGVITLQQREKPHIEVSCEPTLTMRWLMPRLSEFYRLQPHSDVRLSTAGGPVKLSPTGITMAIRRDDFICHQHYHRTPLVEEWVGPVFSPDYWKSLEAGEQELTLLHSNTRPEAWRHWAKTSGNAAHLSHGSRTFDHFYFCLQATADGLGSAIASYPMVKDDIERGVLIAPYGFIPSGHQYVLITEQEIKETNTVMHHFCTWISASLSDCLPDKA